MRIQELIKYILSEAGQDEDWRFRELGPIHIIKYVYLADMYYAMENDGATYTDINWKFHHFGPWSVELYKEIPHAAKNIGANVRTFESKYAKDGIRLSLKEDCNDDAAKCIPSHILFRLRRDIRNFGCVTNDLLHYVYTTPPLTHAKPGELLDFNHTVYPGKISIKNNPSSPKLTVRAKKKRKERILEVREKIAKKREEKKKNSITPFQPRYDEVFFQGTMELDREMEYAPLENHKGVLQVASNAWEGDWRKDRDLP